jgi:DNA anti-recombination protein RmuC
MSLAARLEGALAAAARALEAGDSKVAAEAAALAARVCEEAKAAGARLNASDRDRLLEAFRRAEAAAVAAQQKLAARMSETSRGRRASHAYRR